ncbi:MAG: hypothetical protein LBG60_12725 [Bifidobacteriaceae bacterium]|nr:hypothetical protein [Bifidobacteriaceae bacterium]
MIKDSAGRPGVADQGIEHVLGQWLVLHDLTDPQGKPSLPCVRPETAGRMRDVGINARDDVVHAMSARAKCLPKTKQTRW